MMANKSENNEKVRALTQVEWQLLFNLIPEIEATEHFAEIEEGKTLEDGTFELPYFQPVEIVGDLIDIVISLDLIPGWNWVDWEEGDDILSEVEPNYSKHKIITLCKLLIMIIRADEFDEGFLVENLEDGTVLNILKALKRKVG
jgi:hypothetical protein